MRLAVASVVSKDFFFFFLMAPLSASGDIIFFVEKNHELVMLQVQVKNRKVDIPQIEDEIKKSSQFMQKFQISSKSNKQFQVSQILLIVAAEIKDDNTKKLFNQIILFNEDGKCLRNSTGVDVKMPPLKKSARSLEKAIAKVHNDKSEEMTAEIAEERFQKSFSTKTCPSLAVILTDFNILYLEPYRSFLRKC